MPTLEMISGENAGTLYEIEHEQTVIGRYPFCNIVLDEHTISRQHARIVRVGEEYHVEDMGSMNGTFVNGVKISGRTRLNDQDLIQLFDVVLVFHLGAAKPKKPESKEEALRRAADVISSDDSDSQVLETAAIGSDSRLQQSTDAKLAAVLQIVRRLGNTLDVESVLPGILDGLFKVFPQAERGYILMTEGNGGLALRALKKRKKSDTVGPINYAVAKRVMGEGRAMLTSSMGDTTPHTSESVFELEIHSMMTAPVMGPSKRPQGAISIETHEADRRFNADDLDVMATVATVAGQAVENALAHAAQLLRERHDQELLMARDMQQQFLPRQRPQTPGYQFFDFYQAASEVGGDYFDYVAMPGGRLAIVIADVSGKGVPAAMMMSRLSSDTRSCLLTTDSPGEAVTRLNREHFQRVLGVQFVTFVLAVLDPALHQLTLVNAGHMCPLLRKAGSGEIHEVGDGENKGVPLGVDYEHDYREHTIALDVWDLVLMYTDGLNEAQSELNDLYGRERIRALLSQAPLEPESLGQLLLDDVQRFVGNKPQADDMCLLCFARCGESG